jgi:hypothetical protein
MVADESAGWKRRSKMLMTNVPSGGQVVEQRRLLRFVMVVVLAALAPVVQALPASADTVRNFMSQATGSCLDLVMTDHGLGAMLQECEGGGWFVKNWNDGTIRLEDPQFTMCLTSLSPDGAVLGGAPCGDSQEQSWWIRPWRDGTFGLENQARGLCMRVDTADFSVYVVELASCDASTWESWS